MASDNRPIEPKTEKALKRLKREVADDLGLDDDFKDLDLFNDSGFDEEEDDF